MSKLSEKHLREEKVERLKTKILGEIKTIQADCLDVLEVFLQNKNSVDVDFIENEISTYFCLMQLKRCLESPGMFMQCTMINDLTDTITYIINDKTLDIWLQDNYSFTSQYLTIIEGRPLFMVSVFDEYYLAYNFTNTFDRIAYNKKMEEKKDENIG